MNDTTRRSSVRGPAPDAAEFDSADATVRDRVWDATLDLLSRRPLPFQAWRVQKRAGLDETNERTIRRTLTSMADAGWLEHERGSKWWYPGPKAREKFE